MSKLIIGITGKSGSGKSTVANKLCMLIPNSVVVNIDSIGHEALKQPDVLNHLIQIFGNEILDENNLNIDRKKLGKIVFANPEKMQKLANTTYKYILEKINEIINETKGIVILDWIILPQHPSWKKCDIKILIQADLNKRKEKVISRDKISANYFDSRETTSIDYNNNEFDYIFNKVGKHILHIL